MVQGTRTECDRTPDESRMTCREATAYYQRGKEINDFLKNNPKATVTWLRGKLITLEESRCT